MPRIYIYFAVLLLLVVSITTGAMADDPCCPPGSGLGFSGTVGLDVTFTPIPPLSYNIESGLSLSLSVAGLLHSRRIRSLTCPDFSRRASPLT